MQYISVCCIRSFFFLFCPCKSLSYPCFPPLRDMSRPRKETSYIPGQSPILPHYIIVPTPHNGREIPVFFSSRFWREKIGSRKGPATFLKFSKHFSIFSYQFLLFLWSYLAFSPLFREKRENEIWKEKEPYRASQSLIAASFDSSHDTRKNEMGARSQEGNWKENDRKSMREREEKRGKNPYP